MVRPTLVSCLFGFVVLALITAANAQSTADSDNKEHSLILNPPQRASDSQDRPTDTSSPSNPPPRTTSSPLSSSDAAVDQPPRTADYRAPVEENLPPPSRPAATTSSRKPFLIPNQAPRASRTDDSRDRQVSAVEYRSATPRSSAPGTAPNLLNRPEQARFDNRAGLRSDFGATFDPDSRSGAAVDYVERDSPAYYAGLRRDDLVVGLNGQQVDTGRDATEIIESLRPGQRVDIEFFRHSNAQLVLSDPMARADDRFIDERPSERSSADRLTSVPEPQRQQNLNTYRDNRPLEDRDQSDRRTGIRRLLPRLRD